MAIELDTEIYDQNGTYTSYRVIKAYTQNNLPGAPEATLMRLGPEKESYGWGYQSQLTVLIGGASVRFTFDKANKDKPIEDTTKVTVTASHKGQIPQLDPANC